MTTKLHALCDARGNPLRLILTPGNVSGSTPAGPLLDGIKAGSVLGGKGYDSDAIVACIEASGAGVVIPPKANRIVQRLCDFALYCERNLVERFFCIIKQFRAIATRYEKTAQNFLAGLHLVCATHLAQMTSGLPNASTITWIFVVSPPRERPMA